MAAIDFPNTPTAEQQFTVGDITWEWTGTVWKSLGTAIPGPTGPAGDNGAAGSAGADGEPNFSSFLLMGA
jgi:hypothetical protein